MNYVSCLGLTLSVIGLLCLGRSEPGTRWFGFKDDVVVRLSPSPAGSRIDVRSVSRVGKSDVGTNARRIKAYLARMN